MNILLTGANGFLGKYIYNFLINFSTVYTIGRKDSNINIDLRYQIFNLGTPIDLFIHVAGKAHSVPKSNYEIQDLYKVNVDGTKNVLKSLENNVPKKFVYISSVAVYGLIEGNNISEDKELSATDAYGQSKILSEELVIKWCKINNVVCTILRLPLIVGENPPGNLGTMINGIKKRFYFNIDGGLMKKSMVLAEDVAKCILSASEVGGTFNLTDGYHPNFNELSHLYAEKYGYNFIPSLPKNVAKFFALIGDIFGPKFPINSNKYKKITSQLTFNDTKARKAFGWNPTPVLQTIKMYD